MRKRRFHEEFTKYEFTSIIINIDERPLCAICSEMLASQAFRAKKLIQSLKTRRESLIDSDVNIILGKVETVNQTRLGSCGSYLKKILLLLKFCVAHTTAMDKTLYKTAVQYI